MSAEQAQPVSESLSEPVAGDECGGQRAWPARTCVAFVWGVWAIMIVAAVWFAAALGNNVPIWDEWSAVPYVTGNEPTTVSWLWSLHNEHRIFLPRIVYVILVRLSGDYRAVNVFNAVALGGLAMAFMVVAGRIRGRAGWWDVVFPLLLLNWGHVDNLLWSFQVHCVLSTVLVCAVLMGIARGDHDSCLRHSVLIGLAVAAMPLCGANGLAFVPALALWLLYAGVVSWRSGGVSRKCGAVLVAFAILSLALTGSYFVGYRGDPRHPPCPGIGAALMSLSEILSTSLGETGRSLWPFSAVVVAALSLGLAAFLVRRWAVNREARVKTLGMLMVLAAFWCLAVGMAWGRSGLGRGFGFPLRYMTLVCPLLCWAYLVWVQYQPRRVHCVVEVVLLVCAFGAVGYNAHFGLSYGRDRHTKVFEVEKDLWAGLPVEEVVERHGKMLSPEPDTLASHLAMLREARIGPYILTGEEARALLAAHYRNEYPMMVSPVIYSRSGLIPTRRERLDRMEAAAVHAEGELRFRVPKGSARTTGVYGVMPQVYGLAAGKGGRRPDGVYVSIAIEEPDGKRSVLFSRHLRAQVDETDRGAHEFSVDLPQGAEGELILGSAFGPPGSQANGVGDWVFWTGVEVR